MKTKITVLRHVQYGRERLYPGCALSRAIIGIKGGKVFNPDQIDILRAIGKCDVDIIEVAEKPKDG